MASYCNRLIAQFSRSGRGTLQIELEFLSDFGCHLPLIRVVFDMFLENLYRTKQLWLSGDSEVQWSQLIITTTSFSNLQNLTMEDTSWLNLFTPETTPVLSFLCFPLSVEIPHTICTTFQWATLTKLFFVDCFFMTETL